MDIYTDRKRSEIMSKVKSKDSKIEVDFRKKLWKRGFRYLKNSKKYHGKPDLVLPKYKTVLFLDSCFWHGCQRHGSIPETRKEFWMKKISRNKERDKEVTLHYKKLGWNVIRIWEHDLNNKNFMFNFDKITKR
ncbi:MAG: very short patch repair endonuclease [Candidatus Moraniibacteriota bacterium]|nr:MAG: very short patch repair endonuclease [Candidatus Moranbacteria bacterium]